MTDVKELGFKLEYRINKLEMEFNNLYSSLVKETEVMSKSVDRLTDHIDSINSTLVKIKWISLGLFIGLLITSVDIVGVDKIIVGLIKLLGFVG